MDRRWSIRGAMAMVASFLVVGLFPVPAGATAYTVTSTSLCGGAGTFEQALKDANANPGADTISFTPGLVVDASSCTTPGATTLPVRHLRHRVGQHRRQRGHRRGQPALHGWKWSGECAGNLPDARRDHHPDVRRARTPPRHRHRRRHRPPRHRTSADRRHPFVTAAMLRSCGSSVDQELSCPPLTWVSVRSSACVHRRRGPWIPGPRGSRQLPTAGRRWS